MCSYTKRYSGLKPPKCVKGKGCNACWRKYDMVLGKLHPETVKDNNGFSIEEWQIIADYNGLSIEACKRKFKDADSYRLRATLKNIEFLNTLTGQNNGAKYAAPQVYTGTNTGRSTSTITWTTVTTT